MVIMEAESRLVCSAMRALEEAIWELRRASWREEMWKSCGEESANSVSVYSFSERENENGMTDQVDLHRSTVPITGDPIGVLAASEENSVKDVIHVNLFIYVPVVL